LPTNSKNRGQSEDGGRNTSPATPTHTPIGQTDGYHGGRRKSLFFPTRRLLFGHGWLLETRIGPGGPRWNHGRHTTRLNRPTTLTTATAKPERANSSLDHGLVIRRRSRRKRLDFYSTRLPLTTDVNRRTGRGHRPWLRHPKPPITGQRSRTKGSYGIRMKTGCTTPAVSTRADRAPKNKVINAFGRVHTPEFYPKGALTQRPS